MANDSPKNKKKLGSQQELEKFRSNLLSVISHELNTPLTSMLGSIQLLEEKFPKEDELLPLLKRNAERLRRTVDNLIEISKVDAGFLKVRLAEIDLSGFLLLRKENLKEQLKKDNFELVYEFESDLPHICGDAKRLGHVFDELVLNAMKFSHKAKQETKEPAQVLVHLSMHSAEDMPVGFFSGRVKKTGMYLLVSVQSSLPSLGESPEHFEMLFEPFTPWRDADTRVKEGLGVELAIAKEILVAHEGFIWAELPEKAERIGWKFQFALPLLSRIDELNLVINSRMHTAIGALSKLSVLLIRPEEGRLAGHDLHERISQIIQSVLFRASDSSFWIQEAGEIALLMDDCDDIGAGRVAKRIREAIKLEMPEFTYQWSVVTGPEHGTNAEELLDCARKNWQD